MENSSITSNILASLYSKVEDDENIFELTDKPGIHIVRKYRRGTKPAQDNRRMFITLYVKEDGLINGGIDMVEAKEEDGSGYSIVFDDQKGGVNFLHKKYANFFFDEGERVSFDLNDQKILLRKNKYSVNEFVDILVKNHSSDMFRKSRIMVSLKNYFILEPLFWLAGADYKDDNVRMNFLLQEKVTVYKESDAKIEEAKEPFFKYFSIYKNTLIFSIIMILNPLFWLSFLSGADHFNLTNPFLIFTAFLFFAILEKISDSLFLNIRHKKDSFVYKIAKTTLNMKSKLRV